MVADRAYSPGLFGSSDRGASLLRFATAVPAVGFVHGPADLYPLNAESHAEGVHLSTGEESIRSLPERARPGSLHYV